MQVRDQAGGVAGLRALRGGLQDGSTRFVMARCHIEISHSFIIELGLDTFRWQYPQFIGLSHVQISLLFWLLRWVEDSIAAAAAGEPPPAEQAFQPLLRAAADPDEPADDTER